MLACVAAAIDRRILVNPVSTPRPFPSLYVILYGPSGTKKGGAIVQATWLLSAAVDTVTRYADDFTMEALFGRLARDSKDGGPGARGMVVNEEFADLIGGADYALRSTALLAKLWDCRPVTSRETRGHQYEEVRDAYLTVLGSTSPDWLEMIDPRVLAGGFLRRVLLVAEYGPKRIESQPARDATLFESLVAEFRRKLAREAFDSAYMLLTSDAADRMGEWYAGLRDAEWVRANEKARHFASTIQEHVLRVGACVQMIETGDPSRLELEHWETARALVEGLVPGMLRAYQSLVPTPFARLKALAVRLVSESPGQDADPHAIDCAVMRTGGTDMDTARRAREAAQTEGTLSWSKNGRVGMGRV